MSELLALLNKHIIILDGAMGTIIHSKLAGGTVHHTCNEQLCLTSPELIYGIHKDYFQAGCHAVETNTFGANRIKLESFGLDKDLYKINQQAVELAKRAARSAGGKDKRFVLGSIGPTGKLPSSDDPDLGRIEPSLLEEVYLEQAYSLIESGVDAIIIETCQDILEARCAVFGARKAASKAGRSVPILVNITVDQNGRMLLGTEVGAAMSILEGLSVDAIGLNCSTGPAEMADSIRYLNDHCSLPITCVPNAGMPENVEGRAVYSMGPDDFATELEMILEDVGSCFVGGCCGTTPDHMGAVVKKLKGKNVRLKRPKQQPSVVSALKQVNLRQQIRPLIIGERINSQGSRRAKRLLLVEDYDAILGLAREQVGVGAHVLDVCVAVTERDDEAQMMKKVVRRLASGTEAPIMIDTTKTDVAGQALASYPGRAIVNSVNLEKGGERFEKVLPLVVKYGASIVALTIDDKGMAMTEDRKIEIAQKIFERATKEFGLAPQSLIIDLLTFTLGTGQERFRGSAVETLKALKHIKSVLPEVFTVLGVSNCSYGLAPAARRSINSVFLYHAVEAGLDLAIINPAEIIAYTMIPEEERQVCDDLVYNRDPDALSRLINFYDKKTKTEGEEKPKPPVKPAGTPKEQIREKILTHVHNGLEELLDQALKTSAPSDLISTVLLPAMREVGERMARGELILPFVLQSAEVMRKAITHLEQFMDKGQAYQKGKVILATVYGDVHDIGKNLVKAILSNNGYEVIDLGKEVPVHQILEEVQSGDFVAIGLSALLVSTSQEMAYCVKELAKVGADVPVIVGGAAINRKYARRISLVGKGQAYQGGVFYGADAFAGLATVDSLIDEKGRTALLADYKTQVEKLQVGQEEEKDEKKVEKVVRPIKPASVIPKPPFFGIKSVTEIDLGEVYDFLDLDSLYRTSWKVKAKNKAEFKKLIDKEFAPLLEKLKKECIERHYIRPKAVYGYFPCISEDDRIVIYDPYSPEDELCRMTFPRQAGDKQLCLADYFSPDKEAKDVVGFMVSTIGAGVSDVVEKLNTQDKYSKGFYIHGLGVQCAEAITEYLHKEIREELDMKNEQGKRYSPGYQAWPNLEEQKVIFNLLDVENQIGVTLTSKYQMVPEQSVSAMIVHHSQASYFSVGGK